MPASLFALFTTAPPDRDQADMLSPDAAKNPRLLPLEGAYNVRDLGGYDTVDRKKVKWGKIFRSGDLHRLTEKDILKLEEIPIRTTIDLRTDTEAIAQPDHKIASLAKAFFIPVNPGNNTTLENIKAGRVEEAMEDIYRLLVCDFQESYRQFFEIVMNNANAPVLFHCSAGKDRTGYAAALFLAALGVDKETIITDYMLSAEYVKQKYAHIVTRHPDMAPLMTVKPAYIESAFRLIDTEYGGMERYLRQHLQVDLQHLQERYTE